MESVRLQWIEVTKYRDVSPGTKLSFGEGLNVVLGGSGAATSLLRLVAALLTGKLDAIKDEPFDVACGITAGKLDFSVSIENDPRDDAAWFVDLQKRGTSGVLCTVMGTDGEGMLHVGEYDEDEEDDDDDDDEDGDDDEEHSFSIQSPFDGGSIHEVLSEVANAYDFNWVTPEGDGVDGDVERIRGAAQALDGITRNLGCFGEGLEAFRSITGEHREGLGDTDMAYVSVDVKDGKADASYATFVPAEICDALDRKTPEAFAADALHVSSREAPLLRRAADALGAEEVTLVLPVRERKQIERGQELILHHLELRVAKGGGESISLDPLSDDEKRLFSFLYYAAANPDVVVADDSMSGMTDDGADVAVAALAGRQAFVSTRDPRHLAFLSQPVEGEDDTTFISCTAQKGKAGTKWDTVDEPTAAKLLAAREEGLDCVASARPADSVPVDPPAGDGTTWTTESVRLRRIEITRYRNVSPGTELAFGEGLNVVLGRNGAGKSALLRLLAALSTGRLDHLKDEPFHVAFGLSAVALDLAVTIDNDPGGDASWSIAVERNDAPGVLCTVAGVAGNATLRIGYDEGGDGYDLSIKSPFEDSSLYAVLREVAHACHYGKAAGAPGLIKGDVERLHGAWRALGAVADNLGRFGEGLEVFRSITGDAHRNALGDTDWAYVTVDVKGQKAEASYATFIPAEIRDALARKKPEAFAADALHVSSSEVPFLRKAAEALGAEEVTLVLPIEDRSEVEVDEEEDDDDDDDEDGDEDDDDDDGDEDEDDDDGDEDEKEVERGEELVCNELKLRVVKGGGEPLSQDQLSHGEKRLFSFFYYAAANPHVVLVDDLVSGLARAGAEAAVALLAGRQAFVSARDPRLFAFLPRPAEREEATTFITCTAQRGKAGTEIAWAAMDASTAADLLAASDAGLDRVVALLRAEGLC